MDMFGAPNADLLLHSSTTPPPQDLSCRFEQACVLSSNVNGVSFLNQFLQLLPMTTSL